jgi:hypothetical protein
MLANHFSSQNTENIGSLCDSISSKLNGMAKTETKSIIDLSVRSVNKTTFEQGKKYNLDEINDFENKCSLSMNILQESIILIIQNLEKELIENSPVYANTNLSTHRSDKSRIGGEGAQHNQLSSASYFAKNWNSSNKFQSRETYQGEGKNKFIKKNNPHSLQSGEFSTDSRSANVRRFSNSQALENWSLSALRSGKSRVDSDSFSDNPLDMMRTGEQFDYTSNSQKYNKGECPFSNLQSFRSGENLNIPFKPTEKIKPVNEFDKKIKEIRILLNKMSETNYESQSLIVINLIETHLNEGVRRNEVDVNIIVDENEPPKKSEEFPTSLDGEEGRIAFAILNILSGNTFLSLIYSKLYKELMMKNTIFETILKKFIENYILKIDEEVNYVNPDKDYDGYCKYIKNNDNRKAISSFISNLIKNKSLDKNQILIILEKLLMKSLEFINTENKVNEVEEMTENIYIIVSNIYNVIFETEEWKNTIFPKVLQISQMKNKEHPSISSRIIFKYMDILKVFSV